MFDWLFPGWTPAWAVVAVVALRVLCNVGLTAAVREAAGDAETVTAAALTLCSAGLTVAVLRGDLGRPASYAEFVVQLSLLGIVAAAVLRGDGGGRRRAIVAGCGALVLLLVSVPLYGEATVAP